MKRMLISTALVALVATGCGGGTSKVADKLAVPSASATAEATPEAPLPTSLAGVSADCLKVAQEFSKGTSALTSGGGDISATFGELSKKLQGLKGAVSDAKVKNALDTLSAAYAKTSANLKGVSYKPGSGAPPPEFLAALRGFSTKEFAAAAQTLSAYFSSSCKK
jgi:hypothetical protein